MTATLRWEIELTSTDRCDRCGAGAKLRVLFPTAVDLLLCGHHAEKHRRALEKLDVVLRFSP